MSIRIRPLSRLLGLCTGLMLAGAQAATLQPSAGDPHSYANTQDFLTRDLKLDLAVDFKARVLRGSVELQLQRLNPQARELILDTRDLEIRSVQAGQAQHWQKASFRLAARDAILGSALIIQMPAQADRVRIRYATRPQASGLQWLTPAQTAGGRQPYLFTQSQAIHARSWIPLQDTPQVRTPYEAQIRTPPQLRAVMSADNDPKAPRNGRYQFRMPQAIPSYLIALAVGDLEFRSTGPRSGVYSEPSVVDAAAKEFEDTEQMIERCEKAFGPYRWGRYDLLILPPSFPYGGMENPRLTFASPTVIAGDKSLVSLVAHELAHSWSGNLVTNASWNDFWLNEGFTNHLTYRIMEEVYGTEIAQQERALGAVELKKALALADRDSDRTLVPDLAGRDPDDGVTDVPYDRGAFFLQYLEQRFSRPVFDAFLRGWFDSHAFQSVRTADFLHYLQTQLLVKDPDRVSMAKIEEWLHSPQMPADTPWPQDAFAAVDTQRQAWLDGKLALAQLDTRQWNPRHWEYWLDTLPPLSAEQMSALDQAFGFSRTRNPIIAGHWWALSARSGYAPADAGIDQYLGSVGRMRLITPIYRALAQTPPGRVRAQALFAKYRDRYHPIAQTSIEHLLTGKN